MLPKYILPKSLAPINLDDFHYKFSNQQISSNFQCQNKLQSENNALFGANWLQQYVAYTCFVGSFRNLGTWTTPDKIPTENNPRQSIVGGISNPICCLSNWIIYKIFRWVNCETTSPKYQCQTASFPKFWGNIPQIFVKPPKPKLWLISKNVR